ncbi:unnamed protein product [Pleuronectes platessa]|uniref:Uncharacterized protein n=1 Tax=Pleuronectes platessa TaxID=8262 RepID=A0A9N7TTV3_PLEPL|nr:unnamed protein product [Pleuronectes platessa]
MTEREVKTVITQQLAGLHFYHQPPSSPASEGKSVSGAAGVGKVRERREVHMYRASNENWTNGDDDDHDDDALDKSCPLPSGMWMCVMEMDGGWRGHATEQTGSSLNACLPASISLPGRQAPGREPRLDIGPLSDRPPVAVGFPLGGKDDCLYSFVLAHHSQMLCTQMEPAGSAALPRNRRYPPL